MKLTDSTGTLDGIGSQDHSIGSEYWIVGPPGTGKTTSLGKVIQRDAAKDGPDDLLVTSFSRAAAAKLVNCQLPISPDRVGTLHFYCFNALGSPVMAEAHVKEWNRANPALALTPIKDLRRLHGEASMGDEDIPPTRGGDALLQELNRLRGLMIDPNAWPARVREFERKWTAYKLAAGLFDFCDLIETCLHNFSAAPGNPSVIFADEAQDLNPMQLTLLRQWGRQANYSVFAFDDDQAIFGFTGVSPEAILFPDIPESHKVILTQSHRVPKAVHRLADGLIRQVTRRQPKVYLPRPAQGSVERLSAGGYKSPEYVILSTATKHLEQGKKVMFLVSSAYMLRPLLAVLRKNAIPFHNPYRKVNGYWNPLRLGSPGAAAHRIRALLGPHPYADSYAALLRWWRAHLAPEFRKRAAFPLEVALRRGEVGLAHDPKVVVGTIHSVKGGQADVVYLFPVARCATMIQIRGVRGYNFRGQVGAHRTRKSAAPLCSSGKRKQPTCTSTAQFFQSLLH